MCFCSAVSYTHLHPLAGPLNQTAKGKYLRNPTIAGQLTVENVIYRDSVWKSSRALYDKPIPILTNKDASAHLIIPVAHGIQNRLPNYPLVECRDVIDEESFLVMLLIIS